MLWSGRGPEHPEAAAADLVRGALDAMPAELVVLDEQGDILLANAAWRAFGGDNGLVARDACVGQNYFAACDVAGEDGGFALAAQQGLRDVLAGRRDRFVLEYPCHAPDAKRWFILRAARFALDGATHLVVTHEDITARHMSEDIVRAHEAELAAFNASLSHDLRGPLRRIEMLVDELGAKDRAVLDLIRKETARARDFVSAMIDMSRVSSAPLDLQDVDLGALAQEVIESIDRTLGGRVEWRVEPGLRARGDPALLRFVLENLLHNAWKFTHGASHPKVEVGREVDSAGRTTFYVRDNGVGFAQDDAPRLFRSFQRLANQRAFEGTGLGLASVARIVERHGGKVWATGAPGEGATFWFTLPDARSPHA